MSLSPYHLHPNCSLCLFIDVATESYMSDRTLHSSSSTSLCSPQLGVIQSPILSQVNQDRRPGHYYRHADFVLGILLFCHLHCYALAHGPVSSGENKYALLDTAARANVTPQRQAPLMGAMLPHDRMACSCALGQDVVLPQRRSPPVDRGARNASPRR